MIPGAGRVLAIAAGAGAAYFALRVLIETRRAELRNEQIRELVAGEAARVRRVLDELGQAPAPTEPKRRPEWTVFPWEYGFSDQAAELIRARRYPAGPLDELPDPA